MLASAHWFADEYGAAMVHGLDHYYWLTGFSCRPWPAEDHLSGGCVGHIRNERRFRTD